MSKRRLYGPFPTSEAEGFDRNYEAVRDRAEKEADEILAGPAHDIAMGFADGIKDSDGDLDKPSAMLSPARSGKFQRRQQRFRQG